MEKALAPQRADDPYQPYRLVGMVLVVLVLGSVALELVRNWLHPSSRDFISFWSAARLALSGAPADAYNNAALHAAQTKCVTFGHGEMPFAYPPAFLLLVLPFALVPFAAGMAAWTVATGAAWLALVRKMFPRSGLLALAFPAVYANAAIGQNAFLTGAVMIGGLLLLPARPFVAGLVLGCLIMKPQLALLLPVALLAAGEKRAIAGAATSAAAMLLLGLLVFGIDANRAWLDQIPLYAQIARDGLVGWPKLASVYAAGRQLGLPAAAALLVHGVVALAAAIVVWRAWRSNVEYGAKVAILAAATMLASPYLFFYDSVILTIPLLYLVERKAPVPIVATLWLVPLATIGLAAAGFASPINPSAILPIALLALLWRQVRDERNGQSLPAQDTEPAFG